MNEIARIQISSFTEAIAEAQRFIKKAEAAREHLLEGAYPDHQYQFKQIAAAKRAAADLKVALSDITQMRSI